jgi:dihydropteroate synthase
VLDLHHPGDCREELTRIGVDPLSIPIFLAKRESWAIRLDDLPCSAANILKQTALALGADCAVHRDVIRGRRRRSDVILFASGRQLERIGERLAVQPPAARSAGPALASLIARHKGTKFTLRFSRETYDMAARTYLMGVLNVTPDSFSDGGRYPGANDAVARGIEMVEQEADFVDIGAESTRPGARAVSARAELSRLRPVLKALRKRINVPISIDTSKASVAQACLDQGADLINDVTGLRGDPKMAGVIAKARLPCIVMHMKGTPRTMQQDPRYKDLMAEVFRYLEDGIDLAVAAGVSREQVMVDPGIGFGKSVEDNFTILRRLAELKSLGCPIVVGPSRKSFIGKTLNLPTDDRVEGTIAACVAAIANGANILRVHDVKQVKRAVTIAERIIGRQ